MVREQLGRRWSAQRLPMPSTSTCLAFNVGVCGLGFGRRGWRVHIKNLEQEPVKFEISIPAKQKKIRAASTSLLFFRIVLLYLISEAALLVEKKN